MKKIVIYTLGKLLQIEGIFLIFPFIVALIYQEDSHMPLAYLGTAVAAFMLGSYLARFKHNEERLYTVDGMLTVSLAWVLISIVGAIPLRLSGEYPYFLDAFFEMVSGFTTTGATVHPNTDGLYRSIIFWRSLSTFLGGMGVLIFAIALFPREAGAIHMAKAEMPGPNFKKIVAKLSDTAKILYMFYISFTIALFLILLILGMPVFEAICISLGTAGTGGFNVRNNSIAHYDSLSIELVLAIFMILFAINFQLFYLLLLKQVKKFLEDEELRVFLLTIVIATAVIFLHSYLSRIHETITLRHSFFTVSSVISTTAYTVVDFNEWTSLAKGILLLLMFFGGMAGSTAGGLKISRVIILIKSAILEFRKSSSPRRVLSLRFNKEAVGEKLRLSVLNYFSIYIMIISLSVLLLLLDLPNFVAAFSAAVAAINNIGPGFDVVGPTQNFAHMSILSKLVMVFLMLAGRLEIWPILVMLSPKTWKRK